MFFDVSMLFNLLKDAFGFLGYISGNTSFPKQLKPELEQLYIQQMLDGDEEARNKLIEHNLRLVAHVAKKYTNTGMDNEDVIAIGTIGLIKAVNTYNGKKGTQLGTYAAKCIENEILMTIRSMKKRKNETLLQDPIGVDKEGNQISLIDILGTQEDDVIEEVDLRLQLSALEKQLHSCLTPREYTIITLRYGLGDRKPLTQREIAKKLDISRSYVSRIEKKALQKLNAAMTCPDDDMY